MLSILFVNDEPGHRGLGKIFLERSGKMAVTPAGSAQDALVLLEAQAFDAIVTDYVLSSANCVPFVREIRNRWQTLPIIIFSVWARDEIGEDTFGAGADALVHIRGEPSVTYRNLVEEICTQVSLRRAPAQSVEKEVCLRCQ